MGHEAPFDFDTGYFPTEGIERIEAGGVRTCDGVLHELDVLVLATGFNRARKSHGDDRQRCQLQIWLAGIHRSEMHFVFLLNEMFNPI